VGVALLGTSRLVQSWELTGAQNRVLKIGAPKRSECYKKC
jgi:hypothetical protein